MINTTAYKNNIPVRQGNSSEEVVVRLQDMIQRGELNHGDRLPPERDLAKLLGVSRPTLRAGIRSLAAVGVLQSKQGAGTFVVEAEKSPTLDSSSLRMMAALHGFTSAEMFEARIALEMSIAGLAATRATSEQMTLMSEEIAGMFSTLDEPEKFLVHDMNFHQTVAARVRQQNFDFPDEYGRQNLVRSPQQNRQTRYGFEGISRNAPSYLPRHPRTKPGSRQQRDARTPSARPKSAG